MTKDILDKFDKEFPDAILVLNSDGTYDDLSDDIKQFLKKAIKEVVESVPCEEGIWLIKSSDAYSRGYQEGYEEHCKEVQEWLESITKE